MRCQHTWTTGKLDWNNWCQTHDNCNTSNIQYHGPQYILHSILHILLKLVNPRNKWLIDRSRSLLERLSEACKFWSWIQIPLTSIDYLASVQLVYSILSTNTSISWFTDRTTPNDFNQPALTNQTTYLVAEPILFLLLNQLAYHRYWLQNTNLLCSLLKHMTRHWVSKMHKYGSWSNTLLCKIINWRVDKISCFILFKILMSKTL